MRGRQTEKSKPATRPHKLWTGRSV